MVKDDRKTCARGVSAGRKVAAAVAICGVLAFGLPSPAWSQVGSAGDDRFTPEEYEDARTFALEEGLELSTVLDRFAGLGDFYAGLEKLRAADENLLVGAEWGHGSGFVWVTERGRLLAEETFINAPVGVAVSTAPSERDQQRLLDSVADSLIDNFGLFDLQFDFKRNVLEVAVDPSSPAKSALPADVARAASEAGTSVVIVERDLGSPLPDARGGMAYSTCTGGFVVQSLGVYGIGTAHHCITKPSTYDGSNVGTTTAYSTRDVRWSRFTSGTPQPVFRYGWGNYRTVTSSSNPVIGGLVCKFGTTTGNTCDVVVSSGHCVTYANFPQFCGLYRTGNRDAAPGDSGGPWYYGSRALGIHSGGDNFWNYDQFSGIGSLNLLGVTVITG
jgi:streptogrisin C